MPTNALSVAAGTRKKSTRSRKKNSSSSALQKAQAQVARLRNQSKNMQLSHKEGMASVTHTLALHGSNFGASYLAGYLGKDNLQLFDMVDARLAVGGVAAAYGAVQAFTGESLAGNYAMAVGNGVLSSLVAEYGYEAGLAMAEGADESVAEGIGNDFGAYDEFGRDVYAGQGFGGAQVL